MRIWTLTVDSNYSVSTTLHRSEEDATRALRDNFDPEGEYADVQALLDGQRITVWIEEHCFPADLSGLTTALRAVDAAAEGDSNDAEIDALRDALDLACSILGVSKTDPEAR